MALIEDYALISDTETGALVSRDGSIDWLCLPRFDTGACFAALLGDEENGHWSLAPKDPVVSSTRRYRDDTTILETEFETATGRVRLVDFMPPRGELPDVVRIVEGVSGSVPMTMELTVRFDYGFSLPLVRDGTGAKVFITGPDGLTLHTPLATRDHHRRTTAEFVIEEGERVPLVLTWFHSHKPPPEPIDPFRALDDTERFWSEWASRCTYQGRWRDHVMRSLLTLKALTYQPSGGIVAAPTTSLPEEIGGVRNWDYRYCWLRDATFTLYALMANGYADEARDWREWLIRATGGHPAQMQIMYGPQGERRLPEMELPWLEGYENSKPVRVGNAASEQFQLDVYGEVMEAVHEARRVGIAANPTAWDMQRKLMHFLDGVWREPDDGIWEVRGERRHFTHSKVMAWVAYDRAIKAVENYGLEGPVDHWKEVRAQVHEEVCEKAWNADRQAFTQSYGSSELDASVLQMPMVGFLPATDERVLATIDAIQRDLVIDGLVMRYDVEADVDGLPGGEGAFLPCSFWLVCALSMAGRQSEAVALFERLLELSNDLGLFSEEYDTKRGRLVGNFPQAFTHVELVHAALALQNNA